MSGFNNGGQVSAHGNEMTADQVIADLNRRRGIAIANCEYLTRILTALVEAIPEDSRIAGTNAFADACAVLDVLKEQTLKRNIS